MELDLDNQHLQFDDRPFSTGDVCTVHAGSLTYDSESKGSVALNLWERLVEGDQVSIPVVAKWAKARSNIDLAENEAETLLRVFPQGEEGSPKMLRYLPRCYGTTTHEGRTLTVLERADGFVPLTRVMEVYPEGLDYRDMAWMFRRALEGLFFIHSRDIIHGAIVPDHVLVHPTGHGAKIIDWSYARPKNVRPLALPEKWRHLYPPEIFDREPMSTTLDIYLLGKTMFELLGQAEVPPTVRGLLDEMTTEAPRMRPDSAEGIWDRFDVIMRDLVGKPTYRPLTIPE